ncbi:MAG: WecB/TagA/CpsF family glycosyltransferase [Brachyspira sp.]|nr:WecB/TagA/CpsF family glycosyltransferase [Brachyspira sp.]
MKRNCVKIQGFNVDTFSFEEALNYIDKGQIVTINPEMIQTASNNQEFANIINNAELVIPDGIGVEIGLKILGNNVRRIAGIEFGRKLIDKFAGYPTAFIGAKPDIVQKAVEKLKTEVPDLNPVYVHDGYFKDDTVILNELKDCNPKLALVALGSPKQEMFISKAKLLLPETVFIGLGGSFDVWSGEVKRAPEIYQKMGLEWLYRTVKEPQRFKRIFPTLPMFVLKVFKERITGA